MGARFWLRWAWRDLRLRWPVVIATALVLAIGAGLYATMGAMEAWRTESADASFERLGAHDLRVSLDPGSFARSGRLGGAVGTAVPVEATEERLSVPTQIDASRPRRPLLVAGRLVGSGGGAPGVDRLGLQDGRALTPADAGRPVAVLEENFARAHAITPPASVRVGGDRVEIVGRAMAPEWFIVAREGAVWGAERSFGVVFTTLRSAQRLAGRPGQVNEVVARLPPGTDAEAAAGRVRRALRAELPGLHASVVRLEDEDAHAFLYRDAENDQRVFLVFSLLILAGAALGTFNLVSRVVDAQRREIGIGMALGAPPAQLAARPMLLGAQIAILGALTGVGVALATAELFKPILDDMLPLPVIRTPFQGDDFLIGALLAMVIPLLSAALAVRRSVRLTPVQAIRAGFRSAKGAGLAGAVRRVPLPGGSVGRMPVRNVLRAPRRTAVTVVGVAAVISVVVALGGMVDSIHHTTSDASTEIAGASPDRVVAQLDGFMPASSPAVTALGEVPEVGATEAGLDVPATARTAEGSVDLDLQLLPGASGMWRPTVKQGRLPARGERAILLSRRALDELGVEPGDTLTVRHPLRTGTNAVGTGTTTAVVAGVHGNPFRQAAVADASWARTMRLDGLANVVSALPATGRSADDVRIALAGRPGVAAVEQATAVSRALEDAMDEFGGALQIGWVFAIALAVLLAFNATSINAEERRREHATMFAFGFGPRTVLRGTVVENIIVGLIATLLGVLFGRLILEWVIGSLVVETFPDLGVDVAISGGTIVVAALAGTVAMAATPLLGLRRLTRMDVPSTLRVVE